MELDTQDGIYVISWSDAGFEIPEPQRTPGSVAVDRNCALVTCYRDWEQAHVEVELGYGLIGPLPNDWETYERLTITASTDADCLVRTLDLDVVENVGIMRAAQHHVEIWTRSPAYVASIGFDEVFGDVEQHMIKISEITEF